VYSRLIAWLKILLPLGALVLLSTIFLLSRSTDPITRLPVLEGAIDATQNEQVGSPFYAGTTDAGHALTLAARQARVADGDGSAMIADDLRAVLDISDDNRIIIDATVGQMDDTDQLRLQSGVTLESSSGYTVRTEGLVSAMDRVDITSTGPVDADGRGVTLSAGKLHVEEAAEGDDIQLLFTEGVKLVYVPQKAEAE
jgi:lipopolysaccharide export system protein LptC